MIKFDDYLNERLNNDPKLKNKFWDGYENLKWV